MRNPPRKWEATISRECPQLSGDGDKRCDIAVEDEEKYYYDK